MRVEEKIARAYHRDLSWRKVLVCLEPDAHNNMMVRRMFANAYGWPVVKHLCDTHFGDATHPPPLPLPPQSQQVTEAAVQADAEAEAAASPAPAGDTYLDDSSDEEEAPSALAAGAAGATTGKVRGRFPRLWSPDSKSPATKSSPNSPTRPAVDDGVPSVAQTLTEEPARMSDGAAGPLAQVHPQLGVASPTDLGLRKALSDVVVAMGGQQPSAAGKSASTGAGQALQEAGEVD
jgi:hypothetical protein